MNYKNYVIFLEIEILFQDLILYFYIERIILLKMHWSFDALEFVLKFSTTILKEIFIDQNVKN